jgi:hypothetical protein
MAKHNEHGPSRGDQWLNCAAAVQRSRGLPNPSSKYAEEGTRAHELLELLHTGKAELTLEFCGGNQELYDALALALQTDAENRARFATLEFVAYEVQVEPFRMRKDTGGTADALMGGVLNDGSRGVLVSDFKYGRNKAVPASAPQLLLYALGGADRLGGLIDVAITQVVQPRLKFSKNRVNTHEHDIAGLHEFYFRALGALTESDKPNAPATPGNHCQWCLARNQCPERNLKITQRDVADFEF